MSCRIPDTNSGFDCQRPSPDKPGSSRHTATSTYTPNHSSLRNGSHHDRACTSVFFLSSDCLPSCGTKSAPSSSPFRTLNLRAHPPPRSLVYAVSSTKKLIPISTQRSLWLIPPCSPRSLLAEVRHGLFSLPVIYLLFETGVYSYDWIAIQDTRKTM